MNSKIIEILDELFDPKRLGRRMADGRLFFVHTRRARIKRLELDYNFIFPDDLPMPYKAWWTEQILEGSERTDKSK